MVGGETLLHQGHRKETSLLIMEPIIEQLDEELGMVKITLGELFGFVSSWHLVDVKVNQMRELQEEK